MVSSFSKLCKYIQYIENASKKHLNTPQESRKGIFLIYSNLPKYLEFKNSFNNSITNLTKLYINQESYQLNSKQNINVKFGEIILGFLYFIGYFVAS